MPQEDAGTPVAAREAADCNSVPEPFTRKTLSFRRFAVAGESPPLDARLLERLAANVVNYEAGPAEESAYGWSGGLHIHDSTFSFGKNVYADTLAFCLRLDTNKFPPEMKTALQKQEEAAMAANNPSGFISKAQRREVKDKVARMVDEELKTGKYRRTKLVPVLWDLASATLYAPASGSTWEKLADLFGRTFDLRLWPLTAGTVAARQVEVEKLKPTAFAPGPDGDSLPAYPWTSKGNDASDYLGNEFLLWLWHQADARSGVIATKGAGDVTAYLDRGMDLECCYGHTGKDSIRGDGPGRSPEAREGLRAGKVPRKVGLVLDAFRQQYHLTLGGDSFAVAGARLPEVEGADTARTVFEERIGMVRDLCRAIDALYATFLGRRSRLAWAEWVQEIREWVVRTPAAKVEQVAKEPELAAVG